MLRTQRKRSAAESLLEKRQQSAERLLAGEILRVEVALRPLRGRDNLQSEWNREQSSLNYQDGCFYLCTDRIYALPFGRSKERYGKNQNGFTGGVGKGPCRKK